MTSGIYCIENTVNNKKYIGCSINIEKRWGFHKFELNKGIHHSNHLQKSYNKHGRASFLFYNIEECESEEMFDREVCYIKNFKTNNPKYGYNLTDGGEGCIGRKCSDETRNKISIANTGKFVSLDTRNKISKAGIGRRHSEASKEKMSKSRTGVAQEWHKGIPLSDETKARISESNTGKRRGAETGNKISSSKMGIKCIKNASSQFVGVSYFKNKKPWKSTITINKKRMHLGYFSTEIEAASKYNEMAVFYFGENANLNIIN